MKTPLRKLRTKRTIAFTLVEILLAEAIFLILLVVVVQVVFALIQTAASQKKRMDSLGDARQSLDRLSLDWSGRVRRSDVSGTFQRLTASATNAANAQISFLTQVQPYSGQRHLAWVSYGVNNVAQVNRGSQTTVTPALERGIVGYNWNSSDATKDLVTGSTLPVMSFPATNSMPTLATNNYEPLANTVFRFDYCFLQQVPSIVSPPSTTTISAFTTNSTLNLNSTNVVGVVVGVATLDQQSRQILSQAQLVSLGNLLPAITDGQSPQSAWLNVINNGTFATQAVSAGIPASVANSVRIYQRILYIKE